MASCDRTETRMLAHISSFASRNRLKMTWAVCESIGTLFVKSVLDEADRVKLAATRFFFSFNI
jgi:hypothetical protein